jgi:hypothetical protein
MVKLFRKSEGASIAKLEKPQDLYDIMNTLQKQKASQKLTFTVIELCSNIFENNEKAKIIFKEKFIHLMIDKNSLDEEKIFGIRLAVIMAKTLGKDSEIKLTAEKFGGLGMKMISNSGYALDYQDNKDYFSILAYQV